MARPVNPKTTAQTKVPVQARAVGTAPVATPAPQPKVEPQPVEQVPVSQAIEAAPAATHVQEGTDKMTDAIETAKTYAEEAKTRFQSAFTQINDKAKTAMEKTGKAVEELGDLTKGNLEALVESGQIAAKGVESLSQDAAEYGRKSFEKTSATLKSFAGIKSPAEFFQLQSELFTSTFDAMASETARSSEAVLKLAGDVAKPISNRVAVVSEKIKSFAA